MKLVLKQLLEDMNLAMKNGDAEAYGQAFTKYHEKLVQGFQDDYEQYKQTNDEKILARRGIRQLTTDEKKFWQRFVDASKKSDIKQEITNITTAFPETIITDVYRELVQEHPLLAEIDFKYSSFSTKWIVSDHSKQTAQWGEITSEIAKEIISAFKEYDMQQFKLTAFFVLSKPMLDLGPEWIDSYVRAVLYDSLANALEGAIISGDGKSKMIGFDRDIHQGVSVTDGAYPRKKAVKLKSFRPKEYGTVLAQMAKTEKGNMRKFDSVTLVCNMTDYLTKIMPASTAATDIGTYAKDVFPFPTKTVVSNEMNENEALIILPKEYFAALGTSKDGKIDYDDSVRFFEDQRAYSIKLYGNGRPYDNTVSILLDISEMEEFYHLVKTVSSDNASAQSK